MQRLTTPRLNKGMDTERFCTSTNVYNMRRNIQNGSNRKRLWPYFNVNYLFTSFPEIFLLCTSINFSFTIRTRKSHEVFETRLLTLQSINRGNLKKLKIAFEILRQKLSAVQILFYSDQPLSNFFEHFATFITKLS